MRLDARNLVMPQTRPWDLQTRGLVKALFGRPVRIAVAAWILGRSDEAFFLAEAQSSLANLSEASSAVAQEVNRLASLGLLSKTSIDRRTYYTRLEHPMWQAFDAIVRAADQMANDLDEFPL